MRISVAGPIIVNGSKFVSRSEDCMYSLLSFHFLVLKLIAEIGKCNGASRRLSEMVEDIGGSYGRFSLIERPQLGHEGLRFGMRDQAYKGLI